MIRTTALLAFLCTPFVAHAQSRPSILFPRGSWTFQTYAAYASENNEQLFSGTVGGGYCIFDNFCLNLEATGYGIAQEGPDTGAADLALDPRTPDVVYAVLWEVRQAPWENADFRGGGTGIFKSSDGGTTWRPINKGLPTFDADRLGRIRLTIAPGNAKRLFATIEATRKAGLYRSDDAGESWQLVNDDPRITILRANREHLPLHLFAAAAHHFQLFAFHRTISFSLFKRSFISSTSRLGVLMPCADFF